MSGPDKLNTELKAGLEQREQQGLYRRRPVSQSAQSVHPLIDGRRVLSFCSNDYLGLANHAAIKQALIHAVEQYGVGSGAAHLRRCRELGAGTTRSFQPWPG